MRNIAIAIISLLCVVSGLSAQRSIHWINVEHDFGAFKEDSGYVTCRFKGVNTSAEPISIVSARATCGCTTPEYSHHPFAPGDTLTVTVSYDPEGRPGRFMKKVYIKNSNDDSPDELKIRGVVIGNESTLMSRYPIDCGELRLQRDIVALGELQRGRAKAMFVSVYNQTTDTVTPQLKNLPSYVKSSITPAVIPPGEQASISFHFDAFYCEKWGNVCDTVTLFTNESGDRRVNIEVSANIVPDFSKMTPGERLKAPVFSSENGNVDFGVVNRQDAPVTMEFKVKNKGKDDLKFHRVYSLEDGVEVIAPKKKIKGGGNANVKVIVTPSKLKGEMLNARIIFVVNDPTNPQPIVRVVGELK